MSASKNHSNRLAVFLRRLVYRTPLYTLTLKGRTPSTVHFIPPEPGPGDRGVGQQIMDGLLIIDGTSITFGETPWSDPGNDVTALRHIHDFSWLTHLRAVGTAGARTLARNLTARWLRDNRHWSQVAWDADVIGDRLSRWLACYAFLSDGADQDEIRSLHRAAAMQARHLSRVIGTDVRGAAAFAAIRGLILCGLALPGARRWLKGGLAHLESEISRQILPDGGHIQRNPLAHLTVLRTLISIRTVMAAAHADIPESLQGAIDRMTPVLRACRLGDGRLVRFNGGQESDMRTIDLVLAQSGVSSRPINSAPHTGFQRLQAGRTIIVIDTGPPIPFGETHAGTLGFEMSVGKNRLVVNCGASPGNDPVWREALRRTAAHSTVCINETDSTELVPLPTGGIGSRRAVAVTCLRRDSGGAIWIDASHDGYRQTHGLTHKRSLYLAGDGNDFRGQDILSGTGNVKFVVRFHLHPDVKASMVQGGQAVLLKVGNRGGWRFTGLGGTLGLEDSVYVDGTGTRRRTRQVIISGTTTDQGADIRWALKTETARQK